MLCSCSVFGSFANKNFSVTQLYSVLLRIMMLSIINDIARKTNTLNLDEVGKKHS